jgi:hypothetical protein
MSAAHLNTKIERLEQEIIAATEKRRRLGHSIKSRQLKLNRLRGYSLENETAPVLRTNEPKR